MLQGTSATARSGGSPVGQTRSALVISLATGSGLSSFPGSQLPAASSPRIASGGGCSSRCLDKRVHRHAPAVPILALVRRRAAVVAAASIRGAASEIAAQHRRPFRSRWAAAVCTVFSRAVTPNPSLQRTRQKRRAAELQYRWAPGQHSHLGSISMEREARREGPGDPVGLSVSLGLLVLCVACTVIGYPSPLAAVCGIALSGLSMYLAFSTNVDRKALRVLVGGVGALFGLLNFALVLNGR